jgi:hypothetical protein
MNKMEHKIIWKGERRPLADNNKVTMQIDGNALEGNLPLYLDEVNHSPTGFEWGYYGSGPSQLAYAILRSYYVLGEKLGNSEAARHAKQHYMRFKQDFVGKWGGDEWEITSDQVSFWLSIEKEKDGGKEGWV